MQTDATQTVLSGQADPPPLRALPTDAAAALVAPEYWFSADEMAELAADLERHGADFYRRLAADASDPTVRELAAFFVAQAVEHETQFRAMAADLRPRTSGYSYAVDIRGMLRNSLRELATVLADPAPRWPGAGGIRDALELALHVESSAVVAYRRMRQNYTARSAAVLARILEEEEKHLRLITHVLARN